MRRSSRSTADLRTILQRTCGELPPKKIAVVRLLFGEISALHDIGYSFQNIADVLHAQGLEVTGRQLQEYCRRIRNSKKPLPRLEPSVFATAANGSVPSPSLSPASTRTASAGIHDPFSNLRDQQEREKKEKFVWNPFPSDDVLT